MITFRCDALITTGINNLDNSLVREDVDRKVIVIRKMFLAYPGSLHFNSTESEFVRVRLRKQHNLNPFTMH